MLVHLLDISPDTLDIWTYVTVRFPKSPEQFQSGDKVTQAKKTKTSRFFNITPPPKKRQNDPRKQTKTNKQTNNPRKKKQKNQQTNNPHKKMQQRL